jgi:pentose-5-phosphate-3-epimerase
VRALRQVTSLPLDVHLMISDPGHYVPVFASRGWPLSLARPRG